MRVLTYTDGNDLTVKAITGEQWIEGTRPPDNWEDYIWHENAESVEAAIENHDAALDEWMEEQNQEATPSPALKGQQHDK